MNELTGYTRAILQDKLAQIEIENSNKFRRIQEAKTIIFNYTNEIEKNNKLIAEIKEVLKDE